MPQRASVAFFICASCPEKEWKMSMLSVWTKALVEHQGITAGEHASLQHWLQTDCRTTYCDRLRFRVRGLTGEITQVEDGEFLPPAPAEIIVQGPAVVLDMLAMALKRT